MSNNSKSKRSDSGLKSARLVAIGGDPESPYQHWVLHKESRGLFIVAPITDQKQGDEKIPLEGCTSEESVLQQLANTAGDAVAARKTAAHTRFNFVSVPGENGVGYISDVQKNDDPAEETCAAQLTAGEDIKEGFSVRQVLRHGKYDYALLENYCPGEPCKSGLFRRHSSRRSKWQAVSLPLKVCGAGQRYSHLASYNNRLYLVLDDEVSGFQMWRSDVAKPSRPGWEEVISKGAYDFTSNAHVTAIFVEQDRMLIASAATRKLAKFRGRPVGAELIVVQDKYWGLVIGSTRLSPEGVVVPMGAMGRGFDMPGASMISSISKSDGEYLVSLDSFGQGKATVRSPLWSSHDLLVWKEVNIPEALRKKKLRLLGAYRQGDSLLFAARRCGSDLSGATREASELDQAALPGGVELWLEEDAK